MEQYVTYIGNLAQATSAARSARTKRGQEIAVRYPATCSSLRLDAGGVLVAFPLGSSRPLSKLWIDNVARFFALIGVSMPSFWFGPL